MLQNPILSGSNKSKGSPKSKNECRPICSSESCLQKHVCMLQKGAIQKVSHLSGEFLSNIFLANKSDEGKSPVINLKNVNSFIPYQHFKMEWLHLLKDLLQKAGLRVQNRSLRCIFYNNDKSKVQEISQVQMVGNDVRVSLPLLGTKPSTSDIYKIYESFYCATAATKHSPNNIPGRFAHNDQVSTGIYLHQDTVINLLQNLEFALNLKKSNSSRK